MAAPGTPKATSTPSSSITLTTASMTFILGIRSLLSPAGFRSPDLVLREVLDDPQERRVILAAPALLLHRQEHLVHDGGHGEHHPVLPARCQGDPEVLVVQLRAEAGIELVGEELLPFYLHDLVTCETAGEDVQNLFGGDAAFGTENERLADRLDGERHHDLVGRLGDLAGARGADVVDGSPHYVEERLRALEVLLAPPDHDGERALYGADVPPAHRGVEHRGPALSDLLRQLLCDDGGDGAHVHEQGAFAYSLEHPALSDDHVAHVRRVREHRDDYLALL